MRDAKANFSPAMKVKQSKNLEIIIISGWQLPKVKGKEKGDIIDPYVKVSVHGLTGDKRSFKTKVIKNNGFNPVWKADTKFPLSHPELATLTFVVSDADLISSDDLIAQYSLPVTSLRDGYRFVPLKDKHGKLIEKSSLLIYSKLS